MQELSARQVRRLALARAGLLKPEWTGFPQRAAGAGARARKAALRVIDGFGYLQLDTVSIAGARSHTIVLLSRLDGLQPRVGEELLRPGTELFEYWGHEASWIPMELYPAFAFRRRQFHDHPWWGNVIDEHRGVTQRLRKRIRAEGALKSAQMEGAGSSGWWNLKAAKKVATALWSRGELAIRERVHFQRSYDLTERVIPAELRERPLPKGRGLEVLLLKALEGHGWASVGTLASTWRLRNCRPELAAALKRLQAKGLVEPCVAENPAGKPTAGWIRCADLALADRLEAVRPRPDRGVLLSPFDPLLWERQRVQRYFDFDQRLEIFKPAPQRVYGYYCLPVLAGERLIARFDLKADRNRGELQVLSCRFESSGSGRTRDAVERSAARSALDRYSQALELKPLGWK